MTLIHCLVKLMIFQDQAGQASDGATLRRFNTDVSKGDFNIYF